MRISPVELNTVSNAILHFFAVTNCLPLVQLCQKRLRCKDSRKTLVFTTSTLCLRSGDFPQSQQSVVEKKGIKAISLRVLLRSKSSWVLRYHDL